jgi:tetratricopeptide (TPR) repeat protein
VQPQPFLNLLTLSTCLTLSLYADAQTASQLNTQGYAQYTKRKYAEAIASFQKAAAADANHALSRYNLAATLSLMRKQGKVCEFEAYLEPIFENLNRSVALDSRRKIRALADSDFTAVARTFRWQQLLGKTVPAHTKSILVAVDWYSAGEGVYGSLHSLRFNANGTAVWTRTVPNDDGIKKQTLSGQWTASEAEVVLTIPSLKEKLRGQLSATGELTFDRVIPKLTETKSECEG